MDEKCSENKSEENNSKEGINDGDNKIFEYEEDDKGKDDAKVEEYEEGQEDEDKLEEEIGGEEVEEEGSDEDDKEEEKKLEDRMMQDDVYNVVKNQMTKGDSKNKMPKHAVETVKSSIEVENVFKGGDLKKNNTMKLSESSMSDEDNIFKSICVGDLKKKLADTAVNHFKPSSDNVHITGPFHHAGKSHWVVVYGENKQAFMLKGQFILVYVSCLLREWKKVTKSNINVHHCNTYYDIAICKHQFGFENLWKHTGSNNSPIRKVYLCILMTTKLETLPAKRK
jgi:hypothetical protein